MGQESRTPEPSVIKTPTSDDDDAAAVAARIRRLVEDARLKLEDRVGRALKVDRVEPKFVRGKMVLRVHWKAVKPH